MCAAGHSELTAGVSRLREALRQAAEMCETCHGRGYYIAFDALGRQAREVCEYGPCVVARNEIARAALATATGDK